MPCLDVIVSTLLAYQNKIITAAPYLILIPFNNSTAEIGLLLQQVIDGE
jgi:hypothetical protein